MTGSRMANPRVTFFEVPKGGSIKLRRRHSGEERVFEVGGERPGDVHSVNPK